MSSDSEADEIDTALRILKRKRKVTNKKYNQNKLNSRIRITEQAPVIESSSDSDGYVNNLNNLTQDDLSDFSYLIESDIESEVNESIGLLYNESKTTDSEFLYSLYNNNNNNNNKLLQASLRRWPTRRTPMVAHCAVQERNTEI